MKELFMNYFLSKLPQLPSDFPTESRGLESCHGSGYDLCEKTSLPSLSVPSGKYWKLHPKKAGEYETEEYS